MQIVRYPRRNDFTFFNPFRELDEMRRRMDWLFNNYFDGQARGLASGVYPSVNLSEKDEQVILRAEIPGIKAEELEISVEGKSVSLSGQRKKESPEGARFHRSERGFGKFHKAITLPYEIDAEKVSSRLEHGILTVVLPKAEHAKPRKIQIQAQ